MRAERGRGMAARDGRMTIPAVAGGQAALQLWKATSAAWGGLALDAAYPVDVDRATNRVTLMQLTPDEIKARTPMLAIVGGDDSGLPAWTTAQPEWTKAGIPVQMQVVKGRGHEFLFSGEAWRSTLAWLDRLPHGKASGGDHR